MTNTIKTGLYYINATDTIDVPGDIAHVYEHLFIESFYKFMIKNNTSPELEGGLVGEVVGGIIFLEYLLYNDKTEDLLKEYITLNHKVDKTLLESSIKTVESENYKPLKFNKDEFNKWIEILDSRETVNVDEMPEALDLRKVALKHKKEKEPTDEQIKMFRERTIRFGMQLKNIEQHTAIMRLTPLINNVVMDELTMLGAYSRGMGYANRKMNLPDVDLLTLIVTISKDVPPAHIKHAVKTGLGKLKNAIKQHPEMVKSYIDCFEAMPNWHSYPVDYFKHTAILTSRKLINKNFTPENLLEILDTLEFEVKITKDSDYDEI